MYSDAQSRESRQDRARSDEGWESIRARVIDIPFSPLTREFIEHIDSYGPDRYLVGSYNTLRANLVLLDRVVWEIRRYCAPYKLNDLRDVAAAHKHAVENRGGVSPEKSILAGGKLEEIIADVKHPARTQLIWQNGFFGKKHRKSVRPRHQIVAVNAPLYLHPEILEDVLKLIYVPAEYVQAYKALRNERHKAKNESPNG